MHLLFSFPFYMRFFPLRKYKMLNGRIDNTSHCESILRSVCNRKCTFFIFQDKVTVKGLFFKKLLIYLCMWYVHMNIDGIEEEYVSSPLELELQA